MDTNELHAHSFIFDLEDLQQKDKFVSSGAKELAYMVAKKIDKPAIYQMVLTLSEIKL